MNSGMPFWLKWVALPIAGAVVAFWVISIIVGTIIHAAFDLVILAAIVGGGYWAFNKVMMEVPAYRRRKLRNKQRKDLY